MVGGGLRFRGFKMIFWVWGGVEGAMGRLGVRETPGFSSAFAPGKNETWKSHHGLYDLFWNSFTQTTKYVRMDVGANLERKKERTHEGNND